MTLLEARNLPVWGFPWQSNPYCRLEVGDQSFRSRREDDTSHAGSHRAPVWNQEFQFLVENPISQASVSSRLHHTVGVANSLGLYLFLSPCEECRTAVGNQRNTALIRPWQLQGAIVGKCSSWLCNGCAGSCKEVC